MVRSPHAHARIAGIDAAQALAAPGVLTVLTGADFLKDGLKSIPHRPFSLSPPDIKLANRDGSEIFIAPDFPLPRRVAFRRRGTRLGRGRVGSGREGRRELVHKAIRYCPRWRRRSCRAQLTGLWKPEPNVKASMRWRSADRRASRSRRAHRGAHWVQRAAAARRWSRAAVASGDPAARRCALHAGSGGVVRQKRRSRTLARQMRTRCGGRARHRRQLRHAQQFFPVALVSGGQAPRPG